MKINSTVLNMISVDTPEVSFLVLWLFSCHPEVLFLVHTNKYKKKPEVSYLVHTYYSHTYILYIKLDNNYQTKRTTMKDTNIKNQRLLTETQTTEYLGISCHTLRQQRH